MKLSLYILEDWFKQHQYATSSCITKGEANLVAFQISSQPLSSNIGRVCPSSIITTELDNHTSAAIVSGTEYILVHNTTLEETLNAAYEAYEYYYSWESALLQKITGSTSLQELLEMTHSIFNCPMSICNSRGWDYAMTNGEGPYIHPLREEFLYDTSQEAAPATDRQSFLRNLDDVNPVVIYSAAHKCNVLFANIWLDGERSGAIVAYETETPFTMSDHQIMTVFQNIITIYATINKGILRSRSALSEYLIDVLDKKQPRSYTISKILKYPNWKPSDKFIILCAASRKSTDSIFLNRLCDDLEAASFMPQTFIYDNKMVALINLKNTPDRTSLLHDIKKTISEQMFCWGLSHEFYGISMFAQFYPQACHALSEALLADVPGKTMRETAVHYIREHCSDDENLQALLHPDVLFLIHYDKNNHTLYANTLYWFLLFSCNYTDAANRLNLHRNTLIYRISRIEHLISANLTDVSEREFLLLSFMLCKEKPATEKFPSA
ncbi:MAG: helix-turn-helix domain-containing protein [Lachnospiraceae bacterium]|nr:helix-turn-helix domain-containing protein [Lachnospiraceae bacterium]